MNEPLWRPSASGIDAANITRLIRQLGCTTQAELHALSITEPARFWRAVWDDCALLGEPGSVVLQASEDMSAARFFPEGRLNFAENLLSHGEGIALVSRLEDGSRRTLTYRQLFTRATGIAVWLQSIGVGPGDRVAAFMPNVLETVVVMLGASAIGATFSSCSPDFGFQGVLDRFGQISPRVLVCADAYRYNGKAIDTSMRAVEIAGAVDSIEQILFCPLLDAAATLDTGLPVTRFDEISDGPDDFAFERFPFDHPLYIMYSSGTTGAPKCIVHGAGGTLLQHAKEHAYHVDLNEADTLFYFTTCGWMMWNWLVSGLARGATLVLFDGSPFHPGPRALLRMAEDEGITVFGTSARYLASLEKVRVTSAGHDLSQLRTILSTGSPLSPESFRYVYRDLKPDVCLSSISGGTDIISCFALGSPVLPVFEGELQCLGLGMDVHIFDDDGRPVLGEKGELVCTSPFPSMPVGFWNDPDGTRYRDAYFTRFPGVWAHGDYGELTGNGGMIIHGRSDAVLNPGGVRIGTAEIYRQVEKVDAVVDAVCVGQRFRGDERVVLFVVLRDGVSLSEELEREIRETIRSHATPRHVPAKIIAVPDVPRTISGKTVELAVRSVIHGDEVKNRDALANPEALDAFRNIAELDR